MQKMMKNSQKKLSDSRASGIQEVYDQLGMPDVGEQMINSLNQGAQADTSSQSDELEDLFDDDSVTNFVSKQESSQVPQSRHYKKSNIRLKPFGSEDDSEEDGVEQQDNDDISPAEIMEAIEQIKLKRGNSGQTVKKKPLRTVR